MWEKGLAIFMGFRWIVKVFPKNVLSNDSTSMQKQSHKKFSLATFGWNPVTRKTFLLLNFCCLQ